jgi:hypothetical protein
MCSNCDEMKNEKCIVIFCYWSGVKWLYWEVNTEVSSPSKLSPGKPIVLVQWLIAFYFDITSLLALLLQYFSMRHIPYVTQTHVSPVGWRRNKTLLTERTFCATSPYESHISFHVSGFDYLPAIQTLCCRVTACSLPESLMVIRLPLISLSV